MTRQKNSLPKKKNKRQHLISMDISKMSELEFRRMIIKILAGLEKKQRRHIKELKSNQVEIKKVINELE